MKYGTKIFNEPDPRNKKKYDKRENKICAAAMYNIFKAMENHRIFDRFGFNLPKVEMKSKVSPQFLANYQECFYNHKDSDWKSSDLDQVLTKFQPSPELVTLLDFNIETNIE